MFIFLKCINWRIIALQCCFGSAIQQSKSVIDVHISPLSLTSLPHRTPLRLSQSTRLSSLFYIFRNFPLAICFTCGGVYISMLIFQFAPPSPSFAVSTSLFSMSVSIFLPCKQVYQYHFSQAHTHTHTCIYMRVCVNRGYPSFSF